MKHPGHSARWLTRSWSIALGTAMAMMTFGCSPSHPVEGIASVTSSELFIASVDGQDVDAQLLRQALKDLIALPLCGSKQVPSEDLMHETQIVAQSGKDPALISIRRYKAGLVFQMHQVDGVGTVCDHQAVNRYIDQYGALMGWVVNGTATFQAGRL